MGDGLTDSQRRTLKIVSQSQNPFGENFPSGVQSTRNKNAVIHNPGDHFHHNSIVDVLAPFFNDNPAENLAMVDHFYQEGAYTGNNDKNLTGIKDVDHIMKGGIHEWAIKNNIQLNVNGFQNTGDGAARIANLNSNISKLPFQQRLEAATIFIKQIQPALDEQMAARGYTRPSQKEVSAEWRRKVDAEHLEIIAEKEKILNQLNPKNKAGKLKGEFVDMLLRKSGWNGNKKSSRR